MDLDYSEFTKAYNQLNKWDDQASLSPMAFNKVDKVNSPSHYTAGKVEAINIIEDAIKDASDPVDGLLQAQVLKYMLRLWLKENPKEDAQKARWYLDRLIEKL